LNTYADVAERPDVTLAVMAGAVERDYAKAAGVSSDQLVTLPDPPSLLAAVQAGRADAAALTALSIANLAAKGDRVESTPPFATVADKSVMGHGGFGFRKADKALLEAFNGLPTRF
ncbi:MAG TPA: transporter substrate-binding domain-containing protein, partial [Candidatus Tectomicrobia bacterium]